MGEREHRQLPRVHRRLVRPLRRGHGASQTLRGGAGRGAAASALRAPRGGEAQASRRATSRRRIIAKIETREATEDIERILDVADGAMVARGDLALQIGPHNVPGFQKRLIRLCNLRGKPVITATQMLISMVDEPEPSRAEASDVFNAILDGTDAVMLSDETASGKYPFQAVRTMIEIAEAAESHLEGTRRFGPVEDAERRRLVERRDTRPRAGLGGRDTEDDGAAGGGAGTRAGRRRRLARGHRTERSSTGAGAQKITDEISSAACSFSVERRRLPRHSRAYDVRPDHPDDRALPSGRRRYSAARTTFSTRRSSS